MACGSASASSDAVISHQPPAGLGETGICFVCVLSLGATRAWPFPRAIPGFPDLVAGNQWRAHPRLVRGLAAGVCKPRHPTASTIPILTLFAARNCCPLQERTRFFGGVSHAMPITSLGLCQSSQDTPELARPRFAEADDSLCPRGWLPLQLMS